MSGRADEIEGEVVIDLEELRRKLKQIFKDIEERIGADIMKAADKLCFKDDYEREAWITNERKRQRLYIAAIMAAEALGIAGKDALDVLLTYPSDAQALIGGLISTLRGGLNAVIVDFVHFVRERGMNLAPGDVEILIMATVDQVARDLIYRGIKSAPHIADAIADVKVYIANMQEQQKSRPKGKKTGTDNYVA